MQIKFQMEMSGQITWTKNLDKRNTFPKLAIMPCLQLSSWYKISVSNACINGDVLVGCYALKEKMKLI